MKIILNHQPGVTNFSDALKKLARGADTLSVAVSYLQIGGWEFFRRNISGLSLPRLRLICTDQLNITHPTAISRAMESGVQIRNFTGTVIYHPKVYLAHDVKGRPLRFLVGSANLSSSAFSDSMEAGVLAEEPTGLKILNKWFNHLFRNQSEVFTPERLQTMKENWKIAATRRAHARLKFRRELPLAAQAKIIEPEDLDTLEDVLATIQLPIGLLNIDYAGNNIRHIAKIREVIADSGQASSKQQSELKLLGFMESGSLTELGRAARTAGSDMEVAKLWCKWLRKTPNEKLNEINEQLVVAKRILPQFWQLKPEVRDYFLQHAQGPKDRQLLQTVELLCNAQDIVQELSLEDVKTLAPLFKQSERLPPHIREQVVDYFANKGNRSWSYADRRTVPLAWHEVAT